MLKSIHHAAIICSNYEKSKYFYTEILGLEIIAENDNTVIFKDFAHSPSKLKATTSAVKAQFPQRQLIACMELHTFSSLQKEFLPQYKDAMEAADTAYIYFSEHTLEMKRLPMVTKDEVSKAFSHPNLKVFTNKDELLAALNTHHFENKNLLMMSSGTFDKTDLKELADSLLH